MPICMVFAGSCFPFRSEAVKTKEQLEFSRKKERLVLRSKCGKLEENLNASDRLSYLAPYVSQIERSINKYADRLGDTLSVLPDAHQDPSLYLSFIAYNLGREGGKNPKASTDAFGIYKKMRWVTEWGRAFSILTAEEEKRFKSIKKEEDFDPKTSIDMGIVFMIERCMYHNATPKEVPGTPLKEYTVKEGDGDWVNLQYRLNSFTLEKYNEGEFTSIKPIKPGTKVKYKDCYHWTTMWTVYPPKRGFDFYFGKKEAVLSETPKVKKIHSKLRKMVR